MSRLVKLVPAEAIGPYPFLMNHADKLTPDDGNPRWAVYFVAWVLLMVVVVVRWQATAEPGRGAQWGAVLIAAVSFVIWVHVMGGDFGFEKMLERTVVGAGVVRGVGPEGGLAAITELKQFVADVFLLVWTTLSPLVYRGEEAHA